MSDLTEREIFDRMSQSLRSAIECCALLATLPAKGPTYDKLRTELALIEGCCRQACAWREDTRWLPVGVMMAECHRRAGDWLRHHHPARAFNTLADNLRVALSACDALRTKATGVRGAILPPTMQGPHRETRPVQVLLPGAAKAIPSNILLPPGYGQ